jgi:cobalt-zinc-cadmium efflux system membrane fusion protein
MRLLRNMGQQAPLVFVLLSLGLLWATGAVHFGAPEPAADPHAGHDHGDGPTADAHAGCEDDHGAAPAADAHAGCEDDHAETPAPDPHAGCEHDEEDDLAELLVPGDEGAAADPHADCDHEADPHAGHAHATGVTGDLARLESRRCEHDMRTIDCDDCRFELGVVKVEKQVAANLLGTARVERRAAARTIRLTGQVQFDRTRTVEVPAPAAGRVLSIAVDLGDEVKAGDLLAVLHSGEIGQAKADYLGRVTACEIATKEAERQAGVTRALTSLLEEIAEHAECGIDEEHGAHDAGSAAGYVGEYKAKLLSAAARLRLARIRHERELELEKKGISARSEHEEAHEAYETAKAEYAALVEEVKLGLTVTKLKAENARKEACAAVTAAEQRLRVYGLDDDAMATLAAGQPGADFARLEIRAPRAGTVTSLDVSAGRIVPGNTKLFVVADLENLWVWCDLYSRDLGAVAAALGKGDGVPASLTVSSFPGVEFRGSLDYLGSEVDPHTRTVKARIRVANPERRLRAGMFADVTLALPADGQGLVLVVPRAAVLSDDGRNFVFQHWKDDLWIRRDVEVRGNVGDQVSIDGEIRVGATVATRGAFMLKSDVLREKMGAG